MTLSQINRIRLDKAAIDEGFGIKLGEHQGWLAYDGLGTPASLRLACSDNGYVVATNHSGVVVDIMGRWTKWDGIVPSGFSAFVVADTEPLHYLVREIWRLARALPIEPLREFESRTQALPRSTEVERLVVQRVGQDIFREALMTYWNGHCAVTGLSEPRLLRASHIIPWAVCETDAERLDAYNGLLLAAHLDAAFDAGLISFDDSGSILISSQLSAQDQIALGLHNKMALRRITKEHAYRLTWHRDHLFQKPV